MIRLVLRCVCVAALSWSVTAPCVEPEHFVPYGRWRIEVLVDGVPQYGERALDPFRQTNNPLIVNIKKVGSVVTMYVETTPLVIQMIADGIERPDKAGVTRFFYLAPNALGHTHRSPNGVFDSDVCVPAGDRRTIHCPGVMGDPQGKLHTLSSTWYKLGD